MHKSRLAGYIVDCEGDDLDEAASFWGQALGYDITPPDDAVNGNYRELNTGPKEPYLEVQRVDHPSRVHLDIESDDIEAEVQRLEALGAKKIKQVRTWWVMEAPTGHRFCIVRAQREGFAEEANEWS